MNLSDSERIRSVLEDLGYSPTEDEQSADILGIVACSVRQKAIDKVYARVHRWNLWKKERPLITFVSGCVLPADREKFVDRFDLMFTINELPTLPELLRQHGVVTPASLRAAEAAAEMSGGSGTGGAETGTRTIPVLGDPSKDYWRVQPTYTSGFEAFVPIQNGCDKFCTFCAVPYTRGREVSRPGREILDEVRELMDQGYKSITLLGQNVNSYGLDRRGAEMTFPELLQEIGELGAKLPRRADGGPPVWVYFTSPHPKDMTDEVIDVIAEHDCLAKQIHLPIQSGDDKLLLRMKRNHGVDKYRRTVEKIRSAIPQATLFTDIIVGFTGETDEQFENTRRAMREFRYNMAYIAMYSPRPGAVSARWDDDVPHEVKRSRLHELSEELQEMSGSYNRGLVGTRQVVLVDGHDRKHGFLSGKTEGRITTRFAWDDESPIGHFVEVEVLAASPLSIEGRMVRALDGAPEPVVANA